MQSLLSNNCEYTRIFEMEMEINAINNTNFTKAYLKIRVRGKSISYYFLGESKPHERINLLITVSMNIYQTKKESIPIVLKKCFSEEKLMKQF